jgi:isopropylmalate/homocitrate/citramalate synthase
MLVLPVQVVDVAPRDGLQNESVLLPTEAKVELVNRIARSGVSRIEVTSFVNPRRVPQMADAESVLAAVGRRPGLSLIGLVLNRRGLDRALAAHLDEINLVIVASDTFSRRNQGAGTLESLAELRDTIDAARAARLFCSLTIGASFGCPFEGEVPIARLIDIVGRAVDHGIDEIALADTIGVASPKDVVDRFSAVKPLLSGTRLRCHFHNTRNTGLANAYAAIGCGVTAIDASIGGIGGCPFAPAATGNIPTEDLVYMLQRMGYAKEIDLAQLLATTNWLEGKLGRPVPAMLGRAGLFPPQHPAPAA